MSENMDRDIWDILQAYDLTGDWIHYQCIRNCTMALACRRIHVFRISKCCRSSKYNVFAIMLVIEPRQRSIFAARLVC
jgi:hypothetical protein